MNHVIPFSGPLNTVRTPRSLELVRGRGAESAQLSTFFFSYCMPGFAVLPDAGDRVWREFVHAASSFGIALPNSCSFTLPNAVRKSEQYDGTQ